MRHFPERATIYLRMLFLDLNGEAIPPQNAKYRIDDLTTGTEVAPDTEFLVTPEGKYTIKIDKDQNDIVNPLNVREVHRVSVTGFYSSDIDEVQGVYDYTIDRVIVQPSQTGLMTTMALLFDQWIKYFKPNNASIAAFFKGLITK